MGSWAAADGRSVTVFDDRAGEDGETTVRVDAEVTGLAVWQGRIVATTEAGATIIEHGEARPVDGVDGGAAMHADGGLLWIVGERQVVAIDRDLQQVGFEVAAIDVDVCVATCSADDVGPVPRGPGHHDHRTRIRVAGDHDDRAGPRPRVRRPSTRPCPTTTTTTTTIPTPGPDDRRRPAPPPSTTTIPPVTTPAVESPPVTDLQPPVTAPPVTSPATPPTFRPPDTRPPNTRPPVTAPPVSLPPWPPTTQPPSETPNGLQLRLEAGRRLRHRHLRGHRLARQPAPTPAAG